MQGELLRQGLSQIHLSIRTAEQGLEILQGMTVDRVGLLGKGPWREAAGCFKVRVGLLGGCLWANLRSVPFPSSEIWEAGMSKAQGTTGTSGICLMGRGALSSV